MSSWAGLWKMQKPKTLLKEPLTKALVEFDKAENAYFADPTRQNIAALSGAAKTARRANAETLKLCSPRLHKQGMQWLQTQDSLLELALDLIGKDQKQFVAMLTELNKRKHDVVLKAKTVVTRSNGQVAQKGLESVEDLNKWIDNAMGSTKVTSSDELYAITRVLTKLELAYKEILKAYASKGSGADVSKYVDDLKTHAQALVTPAKGGSMTTQFTGQIVKVTRSAK